MFLLRPSALTVISTKLFRSPLNFRKVPRKKKIFQLKFSLLALINCSAFKQNITRPETTTGKYQQLLCQFVCVTVTPFQGSSNTVWYTDNSALGNFICHRKNRGKLVILVGFVPATKKRVIALVSYMEWRASKFEWQTRDINVHIRTQG